MKAAFYTLGCKVNQNETGALQQIFAEAGYQIVPATEAADVYIVNSCTVTAGGDAKSRQWLRRAKRENPAAITVLTGCYPQAFPNLESLPPADIITSTAARGKLLQNLQAFMATGKKIVDIVPHQKNEAFEELPAEKIQGRTRAFVKIQDGCNRRCAYCIIPKARGPVRSRRQSNILQELEALAATGHREVVFTGINLPSYGRDTGTNLADIVEAAALVPGIERIRLSSLDPDLISGELARRFAGVKKLCPSFHLSLQSGCNATLARMRRPYTAGQYWQAAESLRSALPNASFTTDVIVGFPGETEEEFAESLAFVEKMNFLKVHVFPFSARPGTPAAEFDNQLPQEEKMRRAKRMQQAADEIREQWIAGKQGSSAFVLLEKPLETGQFTGYTETYIPILLNAPGEKQGNIVPVVLGAYSQGRCLCTPL